MAGHGRTLVHTGLVDGIFGDKWEVYATKNASNTTAPDPGGWKVCNHWCGGLKEQEALARLPRVRGRSSRNYRDIGIQRDKEMKPRWNINAASVAGGRGLLRPKGGVLFRDRRPLLKHHPNPTPQN